MDLPTFPMATTTEELHLVVPIKSRTVGEELKWRRQLRMNQQVATATSQGLVPTTWNYHPPANSTITMAMPTSSSYPTSYQGVIMVSQNF